MPLYMDQHILPGVKARDVAEAHRLDMMVQGEHGCQCMTYWVDEKRGNVFCLIEAPDKESVSAMHQKAHGLVPNKVIEVNEELVESFLGRIADPTAVTTEKNGLKVFEDSSLRVILMIKLVDPVFCHPLGKTMQDWTDHVNSFRKIIQQQQGREVDFGGNFLVASFTSINDALNTAMEIHPLLNQFDGMGEFASIALEAGEPVARSSELFGEVINKLLACCAISETGNLLVAVKASELLEKERAGLAKINLRLLQPDEEKFLLDIVSLVDQNFSNPDFDLDNCCRSLAVSTSQLYRRTISVCGMSPNQLVRKIRLEKSKSMLKNKLNNVSQVSFDAGFSSPSYFTKCFKKQYGLLPQAYQQAVLTNPG